jgi:hypothetical protein
MRVVMQASGSCLGVWLATALLCPALAAAQPRTCPDSQRDEMGNCRPVARERPHHRRRHRDREDTPPQEAPPEGPPPTVLVVPPSAPPPVPVAPPAPPVPVAPPDPPPAVPVAPPAPPPPVTVVMPPAPVVSGPPPAPAGPIVARVAPPAAPARALTFRTESGVWGVRVETSAGIVRCSTPVSPEFPCQLSDLPDGPLRVVATGAGSIDERIVAPGSHDVTLTHRGYGWDVLTVLGLVSTGTLTVLHLIGQPVITDPDNALRQGPVDFMPAILATGGVTLVFTVISLVRSTSHNTITVRDAGGGALARRQMPSFGVAPLAGGAALTGGFRF